MNLKEFLFTSRALNAVDISAEYGLNEIEKNHILNNFWPIFKLNNVSLDDIDKQLSKLKDDFIKYAEVFDTDIFIRDYSLDYLEFEIKSYLDCFNNRKVNIWKEQNGVYFLIFDFKGERDKMLLLTGKNYIQVEIFFKDILILIENFKNRHNNQIQPKERQKEINDLQHIEKAQEKRINKYYKTCYPSHIEIARRFKNENGDKNENYIYDLLANYEREQEAEIYQKNSLESDIHERLKQENKLICMFFSDVFKLYDAVYDYKNTSNRNIINRINRYELDVEQRLNDLDYHSLFIARLVDENRIKEAIEVKRFLDNNFKNLVNHFSSYFGIKLKESPLAERIFKHQEDIENSINYNDISFFNKEIESYNSNLEVQQKTHQQDIKEKPKTLKELFKTPNEHYTKSLKILTKVEPPILNVNLEFIKNRVKGAVVLWFDELSYQGLITPNTSRAINADLLNKAIPNLKIDATMLSKPEHKKAENLYKFDFKTLISQIKHSQNSH